jgi:hypothetical protein
MADESFPPHLRESLDVLESELARNDALRAAVAAAERSILIRFSAFLESLRGPRGGSRVAAVLVVSALIAGAGAGDAAAASAPRDVSASCRIHGALQPGGNVGIDAFTRAGSTTNIVNGGVIQSRSGYDLYGWAQDRVHPTAARAVCLLVDGHVEERATSLYGEPRPDVAKVLLNPNLAASGYLIKVPPGTFAPGTHRVSVAVVSSDGSLGASPATRTITVH